MTFLAPRLPIGGRRGSWTAANEMGCPLIHSSLPAAAKADLANRHGPSVSRAACANPAGVKNLGKGRQRLTTKGKSYDQGPARGVDDDDADAGGVA